MLITYWLYNAFDILSYIKYIIEINLTYFFFFFSLSLIFNMVTRKFKVTLVACKIFLLDCAVLEICAHSNPVIFNR